MLALYILNKHGIPHELEARLI